MLPLIRKVQNGIKWAQGSLKWVETIKSLFIHLGNFSNDLDKIWGSQNSAETTIETTTETKD